MLLIDFPVTTKTFRYVLTTVDFYYPMVVGMKNLMIQQRINCEIYKFMLNMIPQLTHLDLTTYISGSYEIKTNERKVLSISLIGLGDFRGANPKNVIRSINIDVNTGKVYDLKDLFKPNSNYVKRLSDIGREQFKEQDIVLYDDEFKGIRPDQDYYIADKNLIIYFQQYEIGPRQSGFPYFSVPIYQIEDIIAENGILERMIYF